MNCSDFELAAQERLDRREPELSEELRGHAASCAECRALWQSQRQLLAATRAWPLIEVPAGLLKAAFAELTAPAQPAAVVLAPQRAARPSAGWVALCSTAALAMIAVTMIGISPSPDATRNNIAAVEPAAPMIASLLTGVQTEYLELSQSTTRTLDQWSELPRTSDLIPTFTESTPSPTDSSPAWPRIDRPVSDRVGQAFDFLWHALPQDEMQSS